MLREQYRDVLRLQVLVAVEAVVSSDMMIDTVVTAPASSLISRGRHDDGRRESSACAMNSAALEYIGLRNIRS